MWNISCSLTSAQPQIWNVVVLFLTNKQKKHQRDKNTIKQHNQTNKCKETNTTNFRETELYNSKWTIKCNKQPKWTQVKTYDLKCRHLVTSFINQGCRFLWDFTNSISIQKFQILWLLSWKCYHLCFWFVSWIAVDCLCPLSDLWPSEQELIALEMFVCSSCNIIGFMLEHTPVTLKTENWRN